MSSRCLPLLDRDQVGRVLQHGDIVGWIASNDKHVGKLARCQ